MENIRDRISETLMAQQTKNVNARIEFILRKNYPNIDISNDEELKKLIEDERLQINITNPELSFGENDNSVTVKGEATVQVFKELV